MKDKEIIYKRVYIHSEEDLPDEDGYYVVSHGDRYDINLDVFHYTKINAKQNHLDWLDHVVFYLQPVELPSEDEITKAEAVNTYIIKKNAMPFELLSQGFNDGVKWLINKILES